ncbi:unconventional myosin-Va-like [Schistocerca serialis cubense]|uniref:unconventional myosin-Va-like n=1 Tax=Schistocerca serialis cubense TaxID=2023355 RepID=UPI00214EE62C|nr:unconventional myosin-Va-like [Schistocerca serialis cubense]
MAQIELLEVKRKFDALRVVETEKKMMVALLQRKDEDLKTLKCLLENERKEKMTIINEKEHFEKEKAEEVERINKENLRLKAELDKLNERIKSNQFGAAEQYNRLQLEVDRWREECIQLHSILAEQTEGLKNVASINYGSHVHLKNEVVELVLAFEAQKKINRQLEDELHQEKNKWQAERKQLQQENEKLREENDNQHKLLSPSLTKSPQTQTEAFMQHEIIRVTSGKLTEGVQLVLMLHQKVKELEKETIKLQKQMEEVEKEKDSPCGDTAFTHVGFRV